MPRQTTAEKPKRMPRDTWQTELQLRPAHREVLEDFAHALRKAGGTHRASSSALVRGLLDSAEPLLRNVRTNELERLAVALEGRSRDEAADLVSAWVKDYVEGRATTRRR